MIKARKVPNALDAVRLCQYLGESVEAIFASPQTAGQKPMKRAPRPTQGFLRFEVAPGPFDGRKSLRLLGAADILEPEDVGARTGFLPVLAPIAAGEPKEAHDGGFPAGAAASFVQFDVDDPNAFGLHVDGDSMTPDFRHGDIIIASPKLGQPGGAYRDGMVAVVIFGSERTATFKVLRIGKMDERRHEPFDYLLEPLNHAHPKLRLKVGEIASILPVVGVVKRSTESDQP